MRASFVMLALLWTGCGDDGRAQWLVRYPADAPRMCAAQLEVWILRGGCAEGLPEVYRRDYGARTPAGELATLAPGTYGFGAGATDRAGNRFAEGCTEVELPLEDGDSIEVRLTRTAAPLTCSVMDGSVDAGLDGGPPTDAGRVDADVTRDAGADAGSDAGTDAGPVSCDADEAGARLTVGCNGPIRGPAADNTFGGRCVFDGSPAGSCVGAGLICISPFPTGSRGLCAYECPVAATYVSQGGCPSGSRCFTVSAVDAFCFADCTSNADCTPLVCFPDGACDLM